MLPTLARTRAVRSAFLTALLLTTVPLHAQTAPVDPEARLRKLEAEVRALQRQVFPGSDGKFFTPQVTAPGGATTNPAVPATTPVTDLLTRMDSVEAQISRLTAQSEETANRVAQIEARLAGMAAPGPAPAVALPGAAVPAAAASPAPATAAPVAAPAATPAASLAPATTQPATTQPATTQPASTQPAPVATKPVAAKPAVTKPAATPAPSAKPSPQRIAAVQKIVKPDTGNAADDEYSYGFRLWEAKFFPEAQQQLRLYVDKYPRDAKISMGRNLLGRAFLDDGKPRDAAPWFLKNYQTDKKGARAAESLLYLAESMRQIQDTSRACIALAEFADTYPGETSGRLKGLYDATRKAVTCD